MGHLVLCTKKIIPYYKIAKWNGVYDEARPDPSIAKSPALPVGTIASSVATVDAAPTTSSTPRITC